MNPTKGSGHVIRISKSGQWKTKPVDAVYSGFRVARKSGNPFLQSFVLEVDGTPKAQSDPLDELLNPEQPKSEPAMSEVDLKIAASEIRTENRIVKLEASLNSSIQELGHRIDKLTHTVDETRARMLTPLQALAGAIGFLAVVVAIISFGNDRFGTGLSVADAVEAKMKPIQEQNDARFERLETRMDKTDQTLEEIKQLIRAQSAQPGPAAK